MDKPEMKTPFWAARRRCPVEGGELRLLSAWEVLETYREGEELARNGMERALCSNACLIARALERDGKPVYADGKAVLNALRVEDIAGLAARWGRFNGEENPSPSDATDEIEARKKA